MNAMPISHSKGEHLAGTERGSAALADKKAGRRVQSRPFSPPAGARPASDSWIGARES